MRKAIILLTVLVLGLLTSLLVEVQTANAQYTQNGAGCPLVSGIGITSPSNTTYNSNLLTLKITIESLFDSTIYRYVLAYSIDGKNNITIPATSFSFDLPNGDTGPFCILRLVGCVALPQLEDGSHSLTVYARYERINDVNTNWPALISDNSTVYFTINRGIPPAITNLSIKNETYNQNNLTLSFTTDKPASWIGYSLDGKANITIAGNTTLTGLPNGAHCFVIYTNDTVGNMGTSGMINFSVQVPHPEQEHSSATLVGALASVAAMGVGLVIMFKKKR